MPRLHFTFLSSTLCTYRIRSPHTTLPHHTLRFTFYYPGLLHTFFPHTLLPPYGCTFCYFWFTRSLVVYHARSLHVQLFRLRSFSRLHCRTLRCTFPTLRYILCLPLHLCYPHGLRPPFCTWFPHICIPTFTHNAPTRCCTQRAILPLVATVLPQFYVTALRVPTAHLFVWLTRRFTTRFAVICFAVYLRFCYRFATFYTTVYICTVATVICYRCCPVTLPHFGWFYLFILLILPYVQFVAVVSYSLHVYIILPLYLLHSSFYLYRLRLLHHVCYFATLFQLRLFTFCCILFTVPVTVVFCLFVPFILHTFYLWPFSLHLCYLLQLCAPFGSAPFCCICYLFPFVYFICYLLYFPLFTFTPLPHTFTFLPHLLICYDSSTFICPFVVFYYPLLLILQLQFCYFFIYLFYFTFILHLFWLHFVTVVSFCWLILFYVCLYFVTPFDLLHFILLHLVRFIYRFLHTFYTPPFAGFTLFVG